MGKGLAFLNLKFFHPGNKENQRRKWEALQQDAERQRKIKERKLELDQEKQLHETRKMLFEQSMGADSEEYRKELKKEQIAWIYNAPPGLKKQIEKERKKIDEEKRLKEWQEAMKDMTKEERRFAEKEIESGLSIHERNVRRFEFLKNAPMVADYVKNMEVTHKPFGKLIRNVRCIKCGKWGHRINDRECEMNPYNKLLFNTSNNNDNKNRKKEKEIKKEKEEYDDESDDDDEEEGKDDDDEDKEENENKHDPLYQMKSKLINQHLLEYDGDDKRNGDVDMKSLTKTVDTQSVFTLNPDQNNLNAKIFHVKSFEGHDGTNFDLIHEDKQDDNDKSKDKKRKHKKRKRKRSDNDDDEYKFILSLDKEERIKLLKQIEKREKKRKKHKKKHKKKSKSKHKHKSKRYDSDYSTDDEEEYYRKKKERKSKYRDRSRSRSRSRSRNDRHKNKQKDKHSRRRRHRSRSRSLS